MLPRYSKSACHRGLVGKEETCRETIGKESVHDVANGKILFGFAMGNLIPVKKIFLASVKEQHADGQMELTRRKNFEPN